MKHYLLKLEVHKNIKHFLSLSNSLSLSLSLSLSQNTCSVLFPLVKDSRSHVQSMSFPRSKTLDEITWVRMLLPKYIVALRAACMDATNFHGHNLIMILEDHFSKYTQYYNNTRTSAAMLLLAKCVSESMPAKDHLEALDMDRDFTTVSKNPSNIVIISPQLKTTKLF